VAGDVALNTTAGSDLFGSPFERSSLHRQLDGIVRLPLRRIPRSDCLLL